ncbi:MAG: amino acid ABC transporter ATP-binding protein, partial [Clostridia bacterium]|nr:amino acid ABC transporter ATP-binding protein [Clostridia bacterium]
MNGNNVIIEVKDLKKHYLDGTVKALNGVDLEIEKGEVVVIIGPSGSGKSTLLRSLNLLEIPTSGSIIVDGVDIMGKKVDINRYRQKMGMVFQHFNLFSNMTVLKNMTKAPMTLLKERRADAEIRAMELLARVGLADRAN